MSRADLRRHSTTGWASLYGLGLAFASSEDSQAAESSVPRPAAPIGLRNAGGDGGRMSVKFSAALPSRRHPHPRFPVCWIASEFRHRLALGRAGQKQVRRVHGGLWIT